MRTLFWDKRLVKSKVVGGEQMETLPVDWIKFAIMKIVKECSKITKSADKLERAFGEKAKSEKENCTMCT